MSSQCERAYSCDMSACNVCDGPVVRCYYCHHYHCDDETCSGMPIPCARDAHASEVGDEQRARAKEGW